MDKSGIGAIVGRSSTTWPDGIHALPYPIPLDKAIMFLLRVEKHVKEDEQALAIVRERRRFICYVLGG